MCAAYLIPDLSKNRELQMERHLTLEYWIDDRWYVGELKEIPGVFSQGETLQELEENIKIHTNS
jgi:hypothetical protein